MGIAVTAGVNAHIIGHLLGNVKAFLTFLGKNLQLWVKALKNLVGFYL